MATKEKDVVSLAKAKKPITKRKPAARRKPAAKKPVEKPLTVEEERDLKAKETVKKLLEDSPITTLEKKDELLELDETPAPEEPKGIEWLEEQIEVLSDTNKLLVGDNEALKRENEEIIAGTFVPRDDVKAKVLELFDELQMNHIKLGTEPNSKIGNFRIYCPGFLNRMILFFPFLEEVKKY